MATFPQEFKDLAAELIDDEFSAFRKTLFFSVVTGGSFDPVTGNVTGGGITSYSYQAIPQPVDMQEWQNTDIQVTDIGVAYTRKDDFVPTVSSTCTFDGRYMQVKAVMLDAAGATVKLILRDL